MEITKVEFHTLTVRCNGQIGTIEHKLDDLSSISNTDYIYPGDFYIQGGNTQDSKTQGKILIGDTRFEAARNVLSKFLNPYDVDRVLPTLMEYENYSLFSEMCKYLSDFSCKDFYKVIINMLGGDPKSKGLGIRKVSALARAWLLRVVFRDVFLFGYSAKRFTFNQHPGFRDICRHRSIFTLNNDIRELYKMYWLSSKIITFIESTLGQQRDSIGYTMYFIANSIFNALCFDRKHYITKDKIRVNPIVMQNLDFSNSSDYGFSIKDDKFFMNLVLVVPTKVLRKIDTSPQYICDIDIDPYILQYENIVECSFDQDQLYAINTAILSPDYVVNINGMPGTGKSTITGCIIYILQCIKKRFKIFTPTGKASSRLNYIMNKSGIQVNSMTCHSFFCTQRKEDLLDVGGELDLIIFDETSMISFDVLYCTIKNVTFSKLIFVGDIHQIPCVNAIDCFYTMINRYPVCELVTIHRNAFKDFNIEFLENSMLSVCLKYPDIITMSEIISPEYTIDFYIQNIMMQSTNKRYLKIAERFGLNPNINTYSNVVLTYRNETRENLTKIIRQRIGLYQPMMVGEPMMILKNDYDYNIMNGDIFIIVGSTSYSRKCYFPDYDKVIELELDYLNNPNKAYYGYILTFHKSQGSEWDRVIIYLDSMVREEKNNKGSVKQYLNRNLIYTAINRAQYHCYIQIYSKDILYSRLFPADLSNFNDLICE